MCTLIAHHRLVPFFLYPSTVCTQGEIAAAAFRSVLILTHCLRYPIVYIHLIYAFYLLSLHFRECNGVGNRARRACGSPPGQQTYLRDRLLECVTRCEIRRELGRDVEVMGLIHAHSRNAWYLYVTCRVSACNMPVPIGLHAPRSPALHAVNHENAQHLLSPRIQVMHCHRHMYCGAHLASRRVLISL